MTGSVKKSYIFAYFTCFTKIHSYKFLILASFFNFLTLKCSWIVCQLICSVFLYTSYIIIHATISKWCRLQLRYKKCLIIHIISKWRRLQSIHIWSVVIIHVMISDCRLQCFHIWFGVIVHATISEWHYHSCH